MIGEALAASGLAAAALLHPRSPLGRPLVRLDGGLALTYDDGPDPRWTPAVLDALAAAGATATFFVLGEAAARHPGLVERAAQAGHRVEVHGLRHRAATLQSPAALRDDLRRTVDQIAALTGRAPRWYRPPWGARPLLPVWRPCGLALVTWSWSCGDWDGGARGAWAPPRAGDVALLHDGPCADADARARTLAVTHALAGPEARALPEPVSPPGSRTNR